MLFRLISKLKILFGLSTTEARGMMILVPVLILLMFVPRMIRYYSSHRNDTWLSDTEKLDSLYRLLEPVETNSGEDKAPGLTSVHRRVVFDPNRAGENELKGAGIPSFLVNRIINYRNAGGVFRKKNDLLAIYDFPEDLYSELEPYILLPDKLTDEGEKKHSVSDRIIPDNPSAVFSPLDINQADSAALLAFDGIGPVLSGRIIRYRDVLGGFVHPGQLSEVYGVKDPVLTGLKSRIFVSADFVPRKLRINFLEWKELVRHPYIGRNLASAIIRQRTAGGPYLSADDLDKIPGMTDSLKYRIAPYLEY